MPPPHGTQHDGLRGVFESTSNIWATRDAHVAERVRLVTSSFTAGSRSPRVLDLGCGPGLNAALFAQGFRDSSVVGLDWATRPLVNARGLGMNVVQGGLDGVDLPFKDEAFDIVMLSEVIEHLVDTDRVLEQSHRVLRPGGVLLVTTPNLAAWFNRLLLFGGVQPVFSEVSARRIYGRPGSRPVGHLRMFTARALRDFMQDIGFTDVHLAGTTYHDVPRGGRWLDRKFARWPSLAATLLAVGTKPTTTASSPMNAKECV